MTRVEFDTVGSSKERQLYQEIHGGHRRRNRKEVKYEEGAVVQRMEKSNGCPYVGGVFVRSKDITLPRKGGCQWPNHQGRQLMIKPPGSPLCLCSSGILQSTDSRAEYKHNIHTPRLSTGRNSPPPSKSSGPPFHPVPSEHNFIPPVQSHRFSDNPFRADPSYVSPVLPPFS